MTDAAFPYRCGRLDRHEPHQWTAGKRGRRTYACSGHVITEYERRYWDDADDAAEERAEQLERDAS